MSIIIFIMLRYSVVNQRSVSVGFYDSYTFYSAAQTCFKPGSVGIQSQGTREIREGLVVLCSVNTSSIWCIHQRSRPTQIKRGVITATGRSPREHSTLICLDTLNGIIRMNNNVHVCSSLRNTVNFKGGI